MINNNLYTYKTSSNLTKSFYRNKIPLWFLNMSQLIYYIYANVKLSFITLYIILLILHVLWISCGYLSYINQLDSKQKFMLVLVCFVKYETSSNYQLGGIALAVCPNPKLGLVPNHDIFHSKVSWSRRSSSGEKCNNVATALVKWRAFKKMYII